MCKYVRASPSPSVPIYTCKYVRICCICINIFAHPHRHPYLRICVNKLAYVVHTYVYAHIFSRMCMYTCIHICIAAVQRIQHPRDLLFRRHIGCVIFTGHFPQKSPISRGSLAEMTCHFRHPMGLCHPLSPV